MVFGLCYLIFLAVILIFNYGAHTEEREEFASKTQMDASQSYLLPSKSKFVYHIK